MEADKLDINIRIIIIIIGSLLEGRSLVWEQHEINAFFTVLWILSNLLLQFSWSNALYFRYLHFSSCVGHQSSAFFIFSVYLVPLYFGTLFADRIKSSFPFLMKFSLYSYLFYRPPYHFIIFYFRFLDSFWVSSLKSMSLIHTELCSRHIKLH